MKLLYKYLTLFALLALFLVPTGVVHAQGPGPDSGGRVIFGSNFTLASGETFTGDLVVFGGNVTVEENADLKGNLVVFGGTAKSNGEVHGDVVIIGGQVNLEEQAHVTGDVVTVGGQLQQADGATIDGNIVNNVQPNIQIPSYDGRIPPSTVEPNVPTPSVNFDFNPFVNGFWVFFWAVVISGFAMLLSLFWQRQFESTGNNIVSQPLMTAAIGLLVTFVGVLFFITILPPIAVAFAWLFGIISMGSEVGERFTKAINQTWTSVLTTGFGTFLLMLVGGAIGQIPCLGWTVVLLLGILGVGGSIVTWFNLRQFQKISVISSTPPMDVGQIPPTS
jgi:cytoskeletal protein CcmA (bactofilin family)